jgi:spore germination protein KC
MKPGKFLLLIYISLTLMIVPGCWSRRELNSLSISQAIAVDLEPDGKIVLTFLFVKPDSGQKQMGGGSGSGMSYVLVSEKGETLFDTQRDIYLSLPRKLFMGQNSLVIYSEQAARAGLGPLMDLFFRHKDFRLTNYVFVTRGKASDMLKFHRKRSSAWRVWQYSKKISLWTGYHRMKPGPFISPWPWDIWESK